MDKIKDTKLGAWLKSKAPNVLDTVGDLLPDKGGLAIVKNLIKKEPGIDPAEAKAKIDAEVQLPEGRYHLEWGGQFEHYQSARQRLMFIVPMAISLAWGVVFATLVTWFLVPSLYLVIEDLHPWTIPESPEEDGLLTNATVFTDTVAREPEPN